MFISILERFWTSKFWKRNLKHELAPCSYIHSGVNLSCSLVSYLSIFHLSFYFLSHVLLELSISKFWKKITKMSSGCQLRNFDFSFWAPFWSRGVHTFLKLKMIIALSSENVNLDFRKVLNPKILKTKSETWTRVVN